MKKNKKLSNFGLADRISVFNSIFDDLIYCHPITQKNKKLKKRLYKVIDILYECHKELLNKQYFKLSEKLKKTNEHTEQPISQVVSGRHKKTKNRRLDHNS